MGRGRAPCCDKAMVKTGPWTSAEDLKLMSFIQMNGHGNWRALPKQAGLLRCGKSCRLRWINYLHPDVKRGNFTREEEEAIIRLHDLLGNKWSKIASHLPGRTDNEIKNVWNTHLKKRLIDKERNHYGSNNESSIYSPPFSPSMKNGNQVIGDLSLHHTLAGSFQSSESEQGTSVVEETMGQPVSSSISDGSLDTNPKSTKLSEQDKQSPSSSCGSERGVDDEPNKRNLSGEVIEIPYEPNLDFWDMLDDGSIGDSKVPVSHEVGSLALKDTFSQEENKREVGSWWWLAYLESELGLEATLDGNQENLEK